VEEVEDLRPRVARRGHGGEGQGLTALARDELGGAVVGAHDARGDVERRIVEVLARLGRGGLCLAERGRGLGIHAAWGRRLAARAARARHREDDERGAPHTSSTRARRWAGTNLPFSNVPLHAATSGSWVKKIQPRSDTTRSRTAFFSSTRSSGKRS